MRRWLPLCDIAKLELLSGGLQRDDLVLLPSTFAAIPPHLTGRLLRRHAPHMLLDVRRICCMRFQSVLTHLLEHAGHLQHLRIVRNLHTRVVLLREHTRILQFAYGYLLSVRQLRIQIGSADVCSRAILVRSVHSIRALRAGLILLRQRAVRLRAMCSVRQLRLRPLRPRLLSRARHLQFHMHSVRALRAGLVLLRQHAVRL